MYKTYEVAFYARKNCRFAYGKVASYVVDETSKSRAKELAYEIYRNDVGTPLAITYFKTEIHEIKAARNNERICI